MRFRPDLVSASEAAKHLCDNERDSIGVTSDTMMQCVGPATTYIQQTIAQWLTNRAIKVNNLL
jgi:hypothetical protein